jgi:hypothetical protein
MAPCRHVIDPLAVAVAEVQTGRGPKRMRHTVANGGNAFDIRSAAVSIGVCAIATFLWAAMFEYVVDRPKNLFLNALESSPVVILSAVAGYCARLGLLCAVGPYASARIAE